MMGRHWQDWINERFGDRPALTRAEAIKAFWSNLPQAELEEFFELIEVEYGLDVGLLRPDDSLDRLTAPIKTKNHWRWYRVEPRIEDAASELNYELCKRADRNGLGDFAPVSTVGEYVRICCGIPFVALTSYICRRIRTRACSIATP